ASLAQPREAAPTSRPATRILTLRLWIRRTRRAARSAADLLEDDGLARDGAVHRRAIGGHLARGGAARGAELHLHVLLLVGAGRGRAGGDVRVVDDVARVGVALADLDLVVRAVRPLEIPQAHRGARRRRGGRGDRRRGRGRVVVRVADL